MTEQEWLECTDPGPMLEFLRDKVSDRKLRLFAVACCRLMPSLFPDFSSRRALELVERFSDGQVQDDEFWQLLTKAAPELGDARSSQGIYFEVPAWWKITMALRNAPYRALIKLTKDGVTPPVPYLRCIFGNPFRPTTFDSSWLSRRVVTLGQFIYNSRCYRHDERRFARLPILADVLTEVGCMNAEILNHCRNEGPHVRGCWVVDLILGKH